MAHPAEDKYISRTILVDVYGIIVIVTTVVVGVLTYWNVKSLHPAPCTPEFEEFTVDITNSTTLHNGSLQFGGLIYPPGTFWYLNGTTRGCPCHVKPCVNKCCPADESINSTTVSCQPRYSDSTFNNFNVTVYDYSGHVVHVNRDYFHIVYTNPCTVQNITFWGQHDGNFPYLMDDGRLIARTSLIFDHSHYCLETFGDYAVIFPRFCLPRKQDLLKDITTENGDGIIFWGQKLKDVCSIIPLPVLFVTVVVYLVLPQLQNVQGRSIIRYSICKFLNYFLPVAYIHGLLNWITWIAENKCIMQFICWYFLLASYFWLNVVCLDIWWMFCDLKPIQGVLQKKRDVSKFRLYSLYAWGTPLIITTLVAFKRGLIPLQKDTKITPEYRYRWCVTIDAVALLILYLPVSILIMVDNYLYVTTASRLQSHARSTAQLSTGGNQRHDKIDGEGFNIYQRLGVIMGMNWLFHLLYFVTDSLYGSEANELALILVEFADMVQIILFFYILVCKKRILNLLRTRFPHILQHIFKPQQSSFGTSTTELQNSVQLDTLGRST